MATLDTIKANIDNYSTIDELALDVIEETKDTAFKDVCDDLKAINDAKKDIKDAVNTKKAGQITDTHSLADYGDRIRKLDLGFQFEDGMTMAYWTNSKTKSIAESLTPDWTSFNRFFFNTTIYGTLDLSGWAASPSDMSYMFYYTSGLDKIILDGWTFGTLKMNGTFEYCYSLSELSMKNVDCENLDVTSSSDMLIDANELMTIDMEGSSDTSIEKWLTFMQSFNSGWYRDNEVLRLFGVGYMHGTILNHYDNTLSTYKSYIASSSYMYSYAEMCGKQPLSLAYAFCGSSSTSDSSPSFISTIRYIDVKMVDTSECTSLRESFRENQDLYWVYGLNNFDTSKVTDAARMFQNDYTWKGFTSSPTWDLSNCTNIEYMFAACRSITSLNLSGIKISSKLTNINALWYGCKSLQWIDISGWDLSHLTSTPSYWGFANTSNGYMDSIKYVKVSGCNTATRKLILSAISGSTSIADEQYYHYFSDETNSLYSTSATTAYNNSYDYIRHNCVRYKTNTTNGTIKFCLSWNTSDVSSTSTWTRATQMDEYAISGWRHAVNLRNMFCSPSLDESETKSANPQITELDFSDYYNPNVQVYHRACKQLINLTKITNPGRLFVGTSSLTNCATMFCLCKSLTEIDFSTTAAKDTSKVTTFAYFVSSNASLTSIKGLSELQTDACTDMIGIFRLNTILTEIDISTWYTPKLTNCTSMFEGDTALQHIDMSMFYANNVTSYSNMFTGCSSLEWIKVENCNTTTKTFLKNRLTSAGYTFILNTSGNYLVKSGYPNPES